MDCFVMGNNDAHTTAKWNLLFNAADGAWSNNLTHNGNFEDFMNNNTGSNEKVLILACHCHFDDSANERWFYYDENPEFKLTRSQIEDIFWNSTCHRLFLWVLTCESANIDVWFNDRNEKEKRSNNSTRSICTRVIAAECGIGKKIKMTDPYITKMLECVVNKSGFSVTDTSNSYFDCHREYSILHDGFEPLEDDGYLVYGIKDLLLQWIAMLEKKKSGITDPTVWSDFVSWSSTDSKGDFTRFQIHDHHALCSNTQKRILNNKFHAKSGSSSTSCSVNVDKEHVSLCTHLRDTGAKCLEVAFGKKDTTAVPVVHARLTDKQRRNEAHKNTKYEESEDTGVGDDAGNEMDT